MEIVEDESHIAGEDRHGSMSLICMAPPDLKRGKHTNDDKADCPIVFHGGMSLVVRL
jgi:hypothetical protein